MEILLCCGAVIIAGLLGTFIGIFIGTDRMRKAIETSSVGNLRIDRSDPDEPPKAFWEVIGSIESISKKNFVILKVINESYLSRD